MRKKTSTPKRRSPKSPASPPAPVPKMCPLAPNIPLADIDWIVVHVAAPRIDLTEAYQRQMSMVVVGYIDTDATLEALKKRFGGGHFYLGLFKDGAEGASSAFVGESVVVASGPRTDSINAMITTHIERAARARRLAEEDRTKDVEFRKTLAADEETLATALAESYHAIVHARFATDPPVSSAEAVAQLAKALTATERGLTTIVKRLQARPPTLFGSLPHWANIVGVGAAILGIFGSLGLGPTRKPKA